MTTGQKVIAGVVAAVAVAAAVAGVALDQGAVPPPAEPTKDGTPKPFCIPGTGCDP